MSWIDHILVTLYIFVMLIVTLLSKKSQKKNLHAPSHPETERSFAEKQFLASRSVSTLEAVFSIAATEFSALTFIQLPSLVMIGRQGLMWGLIGILIGRWVIARFLLKNFYRTGITVFESLSRGVKAYKNTSESSRRGQRLMALIYLFSKLLSVSAGMCLGVKFVTTFYQTRYELVLVLVVCFTSFYTIYGGLKAVVRTDILQFWSILLGGLALFFSVFLSEGGSSLKEVGTLAYTAGFEFNQFLALLSGILGGFVSDFASHGVEQEFVQKLKACKSPNTAARAIVWSTILTVVLQILFLLIGSAFFYKLHTNGNHNLWSMMDEFMRMTVNHLGDGARGLVVVAILSATMSTLDSSINAMSSVMWNDILPHERIQQMPILIKIDNIVVTLFICLFAFFVGQHPLYLKGFLNLNKYTLLPLMCCFILRFVFYPRVMFTFGFHSVVFTIVGCIIGWILNSVYFGWPSQLSIFSSLIVCTVTLLFYEKLKQWI